MGDGNKELIAYECAKSDLCVSAAVAQLSLGVPVGQWSRSLEEAARSLIRQFNITVVVASGNSDVDSCYIAPGGCFLSSFPGFVFLEFRV